MNERQVANKALELADELDNLHQQDLIDGVADLAMPEAATMLRSQEKYINQLHKLLNANNIGAGRDLLTGAIIPFEVEDEHRD